MNTSEILVLAGIYLVVGLIFSVRYCVKYDELRGPDEGLEGSILFTKLFGNWCERHNVEYSYLMFMYSILLWPTYLFTMTFSLLRGIYHCLEDLSWWFFGNSYKMLKGIVSSCKSK